jgi:hypothetical protein
MMTVMMREQRVTGREAETELRLPKKVIMQAKKSMPM